jgi:hypothetical protein
MGAFSPTARRALFFMLLLVAVYFFPILGHPLKGDLGLQLGNEVKIFIFILLLLLATPIGLLINATGWLFFGRIQVRIEEYFL